MNLIVLVSEYCNAGFISLLFSSYSSPDVPRKVGSKKCVIRHKSRLDRIPRFTLSNWVKTEEHSETEIYMQRLWRSADVIADALVAC